MRSRIRTTLACLLGFSILLSACAPVTRAARTSLDEGTGASWTVAAEPLVMARERRDLAVQARDYLTLVAAEINVSGNRRLVLVAHQWSTIDVRALGRTHGAAAPLLLIADGRDLLLQPEPATWAASQVLPRELKHPDDADVVTAFYPIDGDALRYVATAHRLAGVFPEGFPALPFALWRDGRAAVLELLDAIGR